MHSGTIDDIDARRNCMTIFIHAVTIIIDNIHTGCKMMHACRQLFRLNADASTIVEGIHAGLLLGQWIIFMKDAMRPGAQDA